MSQQLTLIGVLNNSQRRPYKDLTGESFGHLKVLEESEGFNKKGRIILWKCRCKCRAIVYKQTSDLTSGKVTNCGCIKTKRMQALGKANLEDLTGRKFGFLKVIKRAPSHSTGNAAWLCHCSRCGSTQSFLSSNLLSGRSKTCGCKSRDKQIKITAFKQTRTLAEWSAKYGISRELIAYRLKQGWTPEDAVSKPVDKNRSHRKPKTKRRYSTTDKLSDIGNSNAQPQSKGFSVEY